MTALSQVTPSPAPARSCDQLVDIFERAFFVSHNTRLVKGGTEPVYLPASEPGTHHRIVFTRDYFASALHEVAHWCIAGAARRQLEDYGYWYAPDGRSAARQREFERVEVKPQALEWVFATAAGYRFRVSVDNLDGEGRASDTFLRAVRRQALDYCRRGLPGRAAVFARALAAFYGSGDPLRPEHYSRGCADV